MTNKHCVFVYGTLRPNRKATHYILGYEMYDVGKFPYIIPSTSHDVKIYGNILRVTDEELNELDVIEGVRQGLYSREIVLARAKDEYNAILSYVYVGRGIHPKLIFSGDWLKYLKEKV